MLTIYLEKGIANHFRTKAILSRLNNFEIILIDRYQEVFHRPQQDYLQQKNRGKAMILAEKKGELVQKNPDYCFSTGKHNYYFSVAYNCPFNCEYCFLQGMFRSAYPIFFVNFEDFASEIKNIYEQHQGEETWFFASYENDILAWDNLIAFSEYFVPFFASLKNAKLELRTKSSQIRSLESIQANDQTVISWSLNPEEDIQTWEKGTASLKDRINAIQTLQAKNWKIGLRLEPLIIQNNSIPKYIELFQEIEKNLDIKRLDSVFWSYLKFPPLLLGQIRKMRPQSKLLWYPFKIADKGEMSYRPDQKTAINEFWQERFTKYLDPERMRWY
ncbi:MAG TPA: DNA photolyase [Candidatus Gracilibacteria bacterium]|nr:DNA photolyase [Candidatus Gracilibacteria bacterium]